MLQALTSSQIAAQAAAWSAVNAQALFGMSGASGQSCDESLFAFGSNPSHCFPIDQGNIGASRFADGAGRVYSLSPLSNDDKTLAGAPPPGGSGGGGDSDDSRDGIGADIAYYALVRLADPTSNNVQLTEPGLADALTFSGIIEWITEEKREAMKATAKKLSDVGKRLEMVEKAIKDREAELVLLEKSINSKFNRILSFCCEKIVSLTSVISKINLPASIISKIRFLPSLFNKIGSISSPFQKFVHRRKAKREQHKDVGGEVAAMRKLRRELSGKVDHKRILDEWMNRMSRCAANYYVVLTDKGVKVLQRMREMGEPELKKINFAYFMKQFEAR